MELKWRGAEYEFKPKTLEGGTDNYTRYSNIDGLIFGADTESVEIENRYEVQCFTCSSEDGEELVYVPERDFVLKTFLFWFLKHYDQKLWSHGVNHHLIYYHNLEYDWLQLTKVNEKLLEMARVGVSPETDVELFREQGYIIYLKKHSLFIGSAPHVKFRVRKGRKSITLYIYDSFSYFPKSLEKMGKDLNLTDGKMERQSDLGKVDFRKIPDGDPRKEYFEKYAKMDAKVTRLAGERIRDLHRQANMTKIRPSAPAYAINLLLHQMEADQKLRTGVNDPGIMQLILDTYRGGRTGGIVHGNVQNLSVLDFHSSYPASMLSLPSFSPNMAYIRLEDLSLDNVMGILSYTGNAFLLVSGEETDPHYPSLLTSVGGKLTPVYGRFEKVATTGYEFFVGVQSGSLSNVTIHDCVVCVDMDDDPFLPFRQFARTAYERKKNSEKGSTEYASAKLALNSAYGKLIESREQTLIGASDRVAYLPYLEGMEKDFGNYYYQKYLEALDQGKTLSDIYEDVMQEIVENFDEETREAMKYKMFGDFTISGRIYGRYVIPAGASLITGCSRARLLVAMKALNAYYWDTDSVFIPHQEPEDVNRVLEGVKDWLPENAVPVRVGDELGELDYELTRASGFLAGTKRYYLEEASGREKYATHGIPALPREQTRDVLEHLATGKDYEYTSKPKPLKAKEAKRVEDIGRFQSKRFVSEFHLDERLNWERKKDHWLGTVKPFDEQLQREISPEKKRQVKEVLQ